MRNIELAREVIQKIRDKFPDVIIRYEYITHSHTHFFEIKPEKIYTSEEFSEISCNLRDKFNENFKAPEDICFISSGSLVELTNNALTTESILFGTRVDSHIQLSDAIDVTDNNEKFLKHEPHKFYPLTNELIMRAVSEIAFFDGEMVPDPIIGKAVTSEEISFDINVITSSSRTQKDNPRYWLPFDYGKVA